MLFVICKKLNHDRKNNIETSCVISLSFTQTSDVRISIYGKLFKMLDPLTEWI